MKKIFFLCLLVAAGKFCTAQTDTLAYWAFNETSGTSAKESITKTDYAIHSKWQVIERVAGIRQNALRTDGYTFWVDGNVSNTYPLDSFSVSAWVALETYPVNTASIWSYYDTVSKKGAYIAIDKYGGIVADFYAGTQVNTFTSAAKADLYKWNFIVLNVDAAVGNCKLYLNGAEIMNQNFPSGKLSWPAFKTYLGRSANNIYQQDIYPINYLNCIYDEIIIRKSKLATAKISSEYNLLNPVTPPDLATPLTRFQDDFHRPKYHPIPQSAWCNESHGLIRYNGTYHMFFQKDGNGPFFSQQNWGHLISQDLISWKEVKPSLYPQPGWESVGTWSGHCITDGNGLPTILYTGVDGVKAGLGSAQSSGDLLNWNRNAANPLIPAAPYTPANNDFRDPYVFKEGSFYYMIIGSGLKSPATGTVFLYQSNDLVSWQFINTLFIDQSGYNSPGVFWEMPVFWKFAADKYMLLVNKTPVGSIPAQTFYWVGTFANNQFTPSNPKSKNLEVINSLLSPTVNLDDQNRVTAIGIIPDLLPPSEQYKNGWANVFSLPRVWQLSSDNTNTLYQSPHPVIESLRKNAVTYSNITIHPGVSGYLNAKGLQKEIVASINPGAATKVGFILEKNSDNSEYTKIYYDIYGQSFVVDRTKSSTNPNTPRDLQSTYFALPAGQPIDWHIYIDGSVIEVFINNKYAFATRVYPENISSDIADVFAEGANAVLTTASIWEMDETVLPVNWLSFSARQQKNNEILLEWSVAYEINNDHYEIEKSNDGNHFTLIGKVVSSGNSSTAKVYSYSDISVNGGIVYYRLKQVDKDGKYVFSKVVSVKITADQRSGSSEILNNPVHNNFSVKFLSNFSTAWINVYDNSGKKLIQKNINSITKDQIININSEMLKSGMYFIIVNAGGTAMITKVIKN